MALFVLKFFYDFLRPNKKDFTAEFVLIKII